MDGGGRLGNGLFIHIKYRIIISFFFIYLFIYFVRLHKNANKIKSKYWWNSIMDWSHKSIARRSISRAFHISPQSSPAGINQTNENQNICKNLTHFSTTLFYNKSCRCTTYLSYGVKHKVDMTIAGLNAVTERANVRNSFVDLVDLVVRHSEVQIYDFHRPYS